ncbi:glycosyltransferase family 9 protein [Spirosoma oryzicola]|uniref:glycosyltransferase family 9 protein n=1 Tax=Spirosoma oryzicola TaxID=2898794 RepID=UPI001E51F173|nr:glycosyltransferase family 9 protein [Spirosoma oryzicola]UHG90040.1 glycosyltransferase family 9 protein [Spirosoma oryzicola]
MITVTNSPRFLICQTAFIGDVILATALLEQLRLARPDAVLDVLVRKGNESLLANHPFINEVLIWEKKDGKYRSLWRLLGLIRSRNYDVMLNLQRFGTTGLLTALSKAGITIGFANNPFSRFFTYRIEHHIEPGVHEVQRNAQFLKPLRLQAPVAQPKLYPSGADYETVRPYQTRPYICMAPTSVWFTKQYPAERWVELIQKLPSDSTIYLLGAPTDAPVCDTILAQVGRPAGAVINLAGKLSLLQSAALQQGARMNYVNDSAPMHLCSAMNAPTTAIFCSTVPEFGFGPLADQSRVVQTREELECKPCTLHGKSACPLGHYACAWGISVDELATF